MPIIFLAFLNLPIFMANTNFVVLKQWEPREVFAFHSISHGMAILPPLYPEIWTMWNIYTYIFQGKYLIWDKATSLRGKSSSGIKGLDAKIMVLFGVSSCDSTGSATAGWDGNLAVQEFWNPCRDHFWLCRNPTGILESLQGSFLAAGIPEGIISGCTGVISGCTGIPAGIIFGCRNPEIPQE